MPIFVVEKKKYFFMVIKITYNRRYSRNCHNMCCGNGGEEEEGGNEMFERFLKERHDLILLEKEIKVIYKSFGKIYEDIRALQEIDQKLLTRVHSVKAIDCSGNSLRRLPTWLIKSYGNTLKKFVSVGNPLEEIDEQMFCFDSFAPRLKKFVLRDTRLEEFPELFFAQLVKVQHVDLRDNNMLKSLPCYFLSMNKTLRVLLLDRRLRDTMRSHPNSQWERLLSIYYAGTKKQNNTTVLTEKKNDMNSSSSSSEISIISMHYLTCSVANLMHHHFEKDKYDIDGVKMQIANNVVLKEMLPEEDEQIHPVLLVRFSEILDALFRAIPDFQKNKFFCEQLKQQQRQRRNNSSPPDAFKNNTTYYEKLNMILECYSTTERHFSS